MSTIDNDVQDESVARAERNLQVTSNQRVFNVFEQYESPDGFEEVAKRGGTKPPVAYRTPGRGAIMGKTLVDRSKVEGCHLIQTAYIEPGNRKYLHRHRHAETVWFILEGEGEFYSGPELTDIHPIKAGDLCHALPGQWHGMGNTGSVPLKYLSIEGPQPYGEEFDHNTVME
jgi:mannose-6-phosphate isomerase-like protein (cupin superfamily)